jgi:hypothetical protein
MGGRHNMEGFSRRELLKRAAMGAACLAFLDPWQASAAPAPAAPRAKAVIQVWLWGGACHLDTFDPKPAAGSDYCGPLNKPISTNADGIAICELLPLLARQADKYSLLRTLSHHVNAHETASYIVQTGRQPDRLVYPSAGAVVSLFKGYDQGYKGIVPPYVVLTEPQGRFSESGFLGPKYKPFATGGDPGKTPYVVEGVVAEGVSDQRQISRRALLHDLDTLGSAMKGNAQFLKADKCEEDAYALMFGDAKKLFDLSAEKDQVREDYGRNTFGQSCLMARRLVEAGVPYVTINYKGWDTHKQHFEIMRRKLPELDRGLATLLRDLSDRGLLESTIVWCGGEFGRSPKILWGSPWNGGRTHYGNCFSALLAGGGFKGGHVVGTSDARGEEVADRPIHPKDLIGSIYELLGIDPEGPLPNARGIAAQVLPTASDDGIRGGGRLHEIM